VSRPSARGGEGVRGRAIRAVGGARARLHEQALVAEKGVFIAELKKLIGKLESRSGNIDTRSSAQSPKSSIRHSWN